VTSRLTGALLLVAVAGLVSGCAALGPVAVQGDIGAGDRVQSGCEQGEAVTISEGPAEVVTWGQPPLPPLGRLGAAVSRAEASKAGYVPPDPAMPDGMKAQLYLLGDDGLYSFYSAEPVREDDRIDAFLKEHGVVVAMTRREGSDVADVVKSTIGDRATGVMVGGHSAAMNRGDPFANGVRPFNIMWSSDAYDWRVMSGLETATASLDVARSIACG